MLTEGDPTIAYNIASDVIHGDVWLLSGDPTKWNLLFSETGLRVEPAADAAWRRRLARS